ncbi:cytochrome o ubiquinol oxidase subunit IV [Aureimonas jatrophae]|uniref:Cytochrome bo(3) ubiquinol oxidase subunit 4 n=1 Tax=Aureimonas jatrophae TaxID=1166073 RepID=A0A1H0JB39_9HYPH|nr:cytochrome o ubiquinol oxidase subunit IV [Aureimonas jatrophae]MBB3951506.1 cytochrome o ubiquinol oxidase operon protein cyoD [Aureimonas jatrophae]SDO40733.1 cytochrome o ubiquinol oxidase operon protein cyoD [Aureimonas jatrophae]
MSVDVDEHEKRRELRSYIVGFAMAVGLTAIAFLVVVAGMASPTAYAVIGVAALAQVVVHFRFFLHISWQRSTRDDLQLILFTTLIITLMAGGTIWILANLHHRMM